MKPYKNPAEWQEKRAKPRFAISLYLWIYKEPGHTDQSTRRSCDVSQKLSTNVVLPSFLATMREKFTSKVFVLRGVCSLR